MKIEQSTITTFALFLTLLMGVCAGVIAAPDKHRAEIITANEAFMGAFNRGDAAALAGLYTEEGSLMPTNSDFVNGKQAIAAVWQSVFDAGIKQAKLETLEVEGLGGVLYEVGKYTLFIDGGAVADSGKYMVIWKMEGGQWKLHRDIFNTSVPAQK
ncbi:MAG: YybH family protein [Methylophagaceae bacterium]